MTETIRDINLLISIVGLVLSVIIIIQTAVDRDIKRDILDTGSSGGECGDIWDKSKRRQIRDSDDTDIEERRPRGGDRGG